MYARNLFNESSQSGRTMLVTLHSRKAGISDKSKKRLLKDLDSLAEQGLGAPTVEAFNDFTNDVVLLNENLKKPKPASELEEIYLDRASVHGGVLNTVRARVCYVASYLGCGMSASRGP